MTDMLIHPMTMEERIVLIDGCFSREEAVAQMIWYSPQIIKSVMATWEADLGKYLYDSDLLDEETLELLIRQDVMEDVLVATVPLLRDISKEIDEITIDFTNKMLKVYSHEVFQYHCLLVEKAKTVREKSALYLKTGVDNTKEIEILEVIVSTIYIKIGDSRKKALENR